MIIKIEDHEKRITGSEVTIPVKSAIRFENKDRKFRIRFDAEGGLEIREIGDGEKPLIVCPGSRNQITIY